jgi:hypothetical protein
VSGCVVRAAVAVSDPVTVSGGITRGETGAGESRTPAWADPGEPVSVAASSATAKITPRRIERLATVMEIGRGDMIASTGPKAKGFGTDAGIAT